MSCLWLLALPSPSHPIAQPYFLAQLLSGDRLDLLCGSSRRIGSRICCGEPFGTVSGIHPSVSIGQGMSRVSFEAVFAGQIVGECWMKGVFAVRDSWKAALAFIGCFARFILLTSIYILNNECLPVFCLFSEPPIKPPHACSLDINIIFLLFMVYYCIVMV